MKILFLIVGILVGGISSFFLTKSFYHTSSPIDSGKLKQPESDLSLIKSTRNWPDSLDAIKAAPESHKVVYEDSTVRILQVILAANKTEPVHAHQWKSIMWFTQATPMIYYKYNFINKKYVLEDSIPIAQMPPEVLNRGNALDAEGPHAIKNLGNKKGGAYRVELKKEFKP